MDLIVFNPSVLAVLNRLDYQEVSRLASVTMQYSGPSQNRPKFLIV